MLFGMPFAFFGLSVLFVGYIIGLGAVTVIDIQGFLARTSGYWTQATIRTHKVTKPLIWMGTLLAIIGALIFYSTQPIHWVMYAHAVAAVILVINGSYLSFVVSPYLIEQEIRGADTELLPARLQQKISVSFIASIIGWWGSLLLFVWYLTQVHIL